jgi:hypothetical protein
MGRNPKETAQIAQRRQQVAELYVKGWFQSAIARELGVSQPTICQDLKAVYKEWRQSSIRDFDELRERELQKLDLVEREAWAAWQRSQEPQESTKVVQDASGGNREQQTVANSAGDPRFLEQVHKCIASRRALLGLDAPVRVAPTSPDGASTYHGQVMLELMRIAEEAKDGPVVIDAQFVEQQLQRAFPAPANDNLPQPIGDSIDGSETT